MTVVRAQCGTVVCVLFLGFMRKDNLRDDYTEDEEVLDPEQQSRGRSWWSLGC